MTKDEIVASLTSLAGTAERDADRIHALEVIARLEGLIGAGSQKNGRVSDNVVILTQEDQELIAAQTAADDDGAGEPEKRETGG